MTPENPVEAAIEQDRKRLSLIRRRAAVIGTVAFLAAGHLVYHEISNGWHQDSTSELDEGLLAFTGGMTFGFGMAYRDRKSILEYRLQMRERSRR